MGLAVEEIPVAAMPRRTAGELLGEARSGLARATATRDAHERFVSAHLAALRTAAAVLAIRAHPVSSVRRRTPGSLSVWTLLTRIAPEYAEWAQCFSAGVGLRLAAETGRPGAVSQRQADDLLRDAQQFLRIVDAALHRPMNA